MREGKGNGSQQQGAEIECKLDKEQRTYNSRQLCQFLAKERKIQLSERHLRRILKKKLSMEKN